MKTPVEIEIDPDFPYDMKAEDFSVNATSTNDYNPELEMNAPGTYIRYLNVLSVRTEGSIENGDVKKIVRCMFGGAYSGMF